MGVALAGPFVSNTETDTEETTRAALTDSRPVLDKSIVAELSPTVIARMNRQELVQAIQAADLPLSSSTTDHLAYYDRDTLERLVYLARRSCRNQGY